MGYTIAKTTVLETEYCCSCGCLFAMEESFMKQRVRDRGTFYCPAGHQQHYTGKTEEQKLREQLGAEQRRAASLQGRAEAAERRESAQKGQVTRLKKRVGNGVCPCCNRHFTNVERHMKTQHPDFATEVCA